MSETAKTRLNPYLVCLRCGNDWISRKVLNYNKLPENCPKCKSHLWNVEPDKVEERLG